MKKSVVLIIGACFMLACSDGKDDPVDPGDLKDKIELCSDNIDNDENGLTDAKTLSNAAMYPFVRTASASKPKTQKKCAKMATIMTLME